MRRIIHAALGIVLFASTSFAQEHKQKSLGVLLPHSAERSAVRLKALMEGLSAHGFTEGKDLKVDVRYAGGDMSKLAPLARDLAAAEPNVIVASGTQAVAAAKKATASIPIVFAFSADPVGSKFVESYEKPGRNITGAPDSGQSLAGRRLEILKTAFPNLKRVAVIGNASLRQQALARQALEDTGKRLGVEVLFFPALKGPKDLPAALASAAEQKADAFFTLAQSLTTAQQGPIIAAAKAQRIPLMFHSREGVEAGALKMLGDDHPAIFRKAGGMVAKILNGRTPAELPVEMPDATEFVVNLKTAKDLGVEIPQSVLDKADAVIR